MRIKNLPRDILQYINKELLKESDIDAFGEEAVLSQVMSWSTTPQGQAIWQSVDDGNFKPFYDWFRKSKEKGFKNEIVPGEVVKTNALNYFVVRNEADWNYGNQDIYEGKKQIGQIIREAAPGWVTVKWLQTNVVNDYRIGAEGAYDLCYATEEE